MTRDDFVDHCALRLFCDGILENADEMAKTGDTWREEWAADCWRNAQILWDIQHARVDGVPLNQRADA